MKVNMSSQAVACRLRRVSQLRRLCLSLGKAKAVETKKNQSAKQKSKKIALR
jgi:hypothetical protein